MMDDYEPKKDPEPTDSEKREILNKMEQQIKKAVQISYLEDNEGNVGFNCLMQEWGYDI